MHRVDLYFDFISPYAYFGWVQIRALCAKKGAALVAHPVLFAGLLNHWGQLGPAEIPPKRRFLFSDGVRIAKLHGLPFLGPRFHPFNPLTALRAALPEVAGERQHDVIDTLFHEELLRLFPYLGERTICAMTRLLLPTLTKRYRAWLYARIRLR